MVQAGYRGAQARKEQGRSGEIGRAARQAGSDAPDATVVIDVIHIGESGDGDVRVRIGWC